MLSKHIETEGHIVVGAEFSIDVIGHGVIHHVEGGTRYNDGLLRVLVSVHERDLVEVVNMPAQLKVHAFGPAL